MELSRYFHTELLWRTFVKNFLCRTFVRNFCVELSWYFRMELLWRTFVELLLGTFVWNFHGTFTRNFCEELFVELFVKNFWVKLSRYLWRNFCVRNFWVPKNFWISVVWLFNSESLGRSFTGLPRRPTLRVRTNLSADLVDFHFSNLWGNYLAPIWWFLIVLRNCSSELFQKVPGCHKIGPCIFYQPVHS